MSKSDTTLGRGNRSMWPFFPKVSSSSPWSFCFFSLLLGRLLGLEYSFTHILHDEAAQADAGRDLILSQCAIALCVGGGR